MDYKKHYNLLIERARRRILEGYKERHHVIPRCMGGDDSADNLVDLTAEEHYVAHQLLVKLYPRNSKLIFAAHRMSSGMYRNNKLYGWIREKHSKAMSNLYKGKTYEEILGIEKAKEKRARISKGSLGKSKPMTEEHRKNLSQSLSGKKNPMYGKKHTEETKEKMRQSSLGKISGMADYWLVTDPNGNEETVYSLRRYCKDHNLVYSSVRRSLTGWNVEKVDNREKTDG